MARRWLAWAWVLAVAGACLVLALRLPQASVESSIFALLPEQDQDPAVLATNAGLREELEKRVLVLALNDDPSLAAQAAEACAARLRHSQALKDVLCAVPPSGVGQMLDFYQPHRFALLSAQDRDALQKDPASLYDATQRVLYLPPGLSGSLGFKVDPFGTWGRWLASRGAASGGLSLRDGHLTATVNGEAAVAVLGTLGERSQGMQGDQALAKEFEAAFDAARAVPGTRVLRSGFVFHELVAARQAHHEMSTIGLVSSVLLLALLGFSFRGLGPVLLGFLSMGVGCLVATAVLLSQGGKVHLITMVFGSTIVGVAVDYGLLFLAGLYEGRRWKSLERLKAVQRSITLGMATSVLGYAALFFVPIPGLRQIGLFSISGLFAAWATVALWYPALAKNLKPVSASAQKAAKRIEEGWPRWGRKGYPGVRWTLAVLALATAVGWARVKVNDDVSLLYARDPQLQAEQDELGTALHMPGTVRYFLLRSSLQEMLLAKEERLLDALRTADPAGEGAVGVSLFVPSQARQQADTALLKAALFGKAQVAGRLAGDLGSPSLAQSLQRSLKSQSKTLSIDDWMAAPVSAPFRYLWRGQQTGGWTTVVPLPASLSLSAESLQALSYSVDPGILLVDQVQSVSQTLGTLRRQLVWVLSLGALGIAAALFFSLGRRTWAALAPTALGVGAGLGALGLSGLPLNLFALLAVALILGMGIDYGIFMQDSTQKARASALVAINLGAVSNLLAFGMLVLSSTPALKVFGLVLAVGLGVAWLSAPCFSVSSQRRKA